MVLVGYVKFAIDEFHHQTTQNCDTKNENVYDRLSMYTIAILLSYVAIYKKRRHQNFNALKFHADIVVLT